MKKWHEKQLIRKEFKEEDRLLLFISILKLFPRKLKSRWIGPFTVISVTSYGAISFRSDNGQEFKCIQQHIGQ